MNRTPFVLMLIAALTGGAGADEKIQARDLPAAVRQALERETRGATIKGYARERNTGQTFYEVETTVNGRSRDLLFDARGQLVEVEEAIDLAAAPTAVRQAFESHGVVLSVEAVTRSGHTKYEGVVRLKSGKKSEIAVDADGKPVK